MDRFVVAMGLAFVAIFVLIRSVRIALIALLANLFPLVLCLGAMGLAGIPLRAYTAIVCSVAFGIAVDDTIHFLTRCAREAGMRQRPLEEAVRVALMETGRAMCITTVALSLGFGLLTRSVFQGNRMFGLITSIALVAALVADMLMHPALLLLVRPTVPSRFRRARTTAL